MKEFDCNLTPDSGGQVFRSALSIASILQEPIKLANIRKNRPKPGLRPQHAMAAKMLKTITNGKIDGAVVGSSELEFTPGKVSGGIFKANIGTAGSISLLIQTLLGPILFADEKIQLKIFGGTDVPFSPPFSFMKNVLFPALNRSGTRFSMNVERRGYYPAGNGAVSFEALPAKLPLKPFKIAKFGDVDYVKMISHAKNLPKDVCMHQVISAKKILPSDWEYKAEIDCVDSHEGRGAGIECYAVCNKSVLSGSALNPKNRSALKTGKEAAKKLLHELKMKKGCDSHLADQLILFMALAKGKSVIETNILTNHTLTNIQVVEALLGVKFKVQGILDFPARIECKGLAFSKQ